MKKNILLMMLIAVMASCGGKNDKKAEADAKPEGRRIRSAADLRLTPGPASRGRCSGIKIQ